MQRYEQYQVDKGDNLGDPEYWNTRFKDIDIRIAARESDATAIDDAINTLESVALARLDNTFGPLIAQAEEALSTYGVDFSALSTTSNVVGMGQKTFILTEDTRAAFYYANYVSIRVANDHATVMLCEVVSYTRATGTLLVDVNSFVGSGTYDSWDLNIGAAPDTVHAGRTDNPHETTAAQVGAYTIAQTDAAIDAAVDALPPITNALLKANNLSDLTDKAAARTNMQLGGLAIESMVGTGMFASNVRATQAQAEAGTDDVTMMSPLRTYQQVTARQATQAEAEAGSDNVKGMTPLRTKQAIDKISAVRLFKNLYADQTGQNTSSPQPWFPQAGAVTLEANAAYRFDGFLHFTRAAGTWSHSTILQFGGTATITSIRGTAYCNNEDSISLYHPSHILFDTVAGVTVKDATYSATEHVWLHVLGTVRINAGGTFIPQFKYSSAPGGTPTIKANSFFELTKIGAGNVLSQGTWS